MDPTKIISTDNIKAFLDFGFQTKETKWNNRRFVEATPPTGWEFKRSLVLSHAAAGVWYDTKKCIRIAMVWEEDRPKDTLTSQIMSDDFHEKTKVERENRKIRDENTEKYGSFKWTPKHPFCVYYNTPQDEKTIFCYKYKKAPVIFFETRESAEKFIKLKEFKMNYDIIEIRDPKKDITSDEDRKALIEEPSGLDFNIIKK